MRIGAVICAWEQKHELMEGEPVKSRTWVLENVLEGEG